MSAGTGPVNLKVDKPQGSSERVLPWQVTMSQLIFASLSHTHYWYEVGMLKVPACAAQINKRMRFTLGELRQRARAPFCDYQYDYQSISNPCQALRHPICARRLHSWLRGQGASLCVCVCVCVCACVFIKLHITAQSGPLILVILCHSH